jgi:DNA polymerase-3 subunit beta
VLPAIAAKSTMPILDTVKLVVDDGRVTLTATNLETTISARLGAKVETPGACCVPAKVLAELVHGFPNDRIICALDGQILTLTVAHYQTTVECLDIDDFPNIPQVQATADAPLAFIRDLVTLVAPVASTDDTRAALRGVNVSLNGTAEAMAGDGFRLARLEHALEGATIPAVAALIPARALHAAGKALKTLDEQPVRIGVTKAAAGDAFGAVSACVIDAGDIQIITSIIDGTFPDVARVIPEQFTTRVVIETEELRKAVVVASIYAKRSAEIIKINVEPPAGELGAGRLTLSANALSVGSSTVTLDAMVAGISTTIALKASFLAAALGCISTPQVALDVQSAQSPAVFKPVGLDTYLQIVMPMTVR